MSAADKPPWECVQFVNLATFLQWRDLQLSLSTSPFTPSARQTLLVESTAEHVNSIQEEVLAKKNAIEAFENQDEWELRKKITNPYEYIFAVSSDSNSLPGILQHTRTFSPLSRSFFKMIEMLHVSKFFETIQSTSIQSSHICEGPGGFIQAFLYLSSKYKRKVSAAYAMTLRPTQPFIPGWRRSIHYLREHPEIVLEYGKDNTGNILNLENQKQYISKSSHKSLLFTADGGFDFSNDYSNQEITAFPLIVASFRMGIQSLAKGGFMIIKVFDVFSEATKQLLLGTGMCFESFTIYKPATSRPCNSERYFIGRGFLGLPSVVAWANHLETLFRRVNASPTSVSSLFNTPFTQSLYTLFDTQIQNQAEHQIRSINSILNYRPEQKESFYTLGIQSSREWVSLFMPHSASLPPPPAPAPLPPLP